MRRRTKIILVLGAIVLLALGWVVFTSEQEPEYNGKKLSEWLDDYEGGGTVETAQADEAFRHMGTSAIPRLVKWINYMPPAGWDRFSKRLDDLFGVRLKDNQSGGRSWAAIKALQALGPAAEPVIPELARCLYQPDDEWIALRAAKALSDLGPKARQIVFDALDNTNPVVCCAGIFGVLIKPNISNTPAIPKLVKCLSHPQQRVARDAAWALGMLTNTPGISLPALINSVNDNRPEVRHQAIASLGNFGLQASNALDVLFVSLQSSNRHCREVATNAIRKIAPHALPK